MTEIQVKQERIRQLLEANKLDALLLRRAGSFAWATCGASSYINTATTTGAASLLVTPAGKYVLTSNIEAPRLDREEHLATQGGKSQLTRGNQETTAGLALRAG